MISREEIRKRVAEAAFGNPRVSNTYRGLVAEVIVQAALPMQWKWCSADWAGWDFEHEDGCKLEVKQSAAMQSWSKGELSRCSFGIAPSDGYYSGSDWTSELGRKASIYVFAHHDGTDPQSVDHIDPNQWRFYVIPAEHLPPSRSISLSPLAKLSGRVWREIDMDRKFPCDLSGLGDAVEFIRKRLERLSTVGVTPSD